MIGKETLWESELAQNAHYINHRKYQYLKNEAEMERSVNN